MLQYVAIKIFNLTTPNTLIHTNTHSFIHSFIRLPHHDNSNRKRFEFIYLSKLWIMAIHIMWYVLWQCVSRFPHISPSHIKSKWSIEVSFAFILTFNSDDYIGIFLHLLNKWITNDNNNKKTKLELDFQCFYCTLYSLVLSFTFLRWKKLNFN